MQGIPLLVQFSEERSGMEKSLGRDQRAAAGDARQEDRRAASEMRGEIRSVSAAASPPAAERIRQQRPQRRGAFMLKVNQFDKGHSLGAFFIEYLLVTKSDDIITRLSYSLLADTFVLI